MNKQPLLILLLCFVAGILLCDFFHPEAFLVNAFLALSLLLLIFSFFKVKFFLRLRNLFLGFFFFSVGLFSHFLNSRVPYFPDFKGQQKVIFQLNKKLNSNEKFRRYEVSVFEIENVKNKQIFPLNLVLSIPKQEKQLDFKHYYQTELYLNKIEAPQNDFQFNYAQYLARKNIFHQGFVSNEVLDSPKETMVMADKIRQKRLEVLHNIDTSTLQSDTKEFLKGIILADRTEMDAEMVQDFSKSGLVHFLAISGTHFAVIFWMLLFVLKPLFPVKFRNFPIIISLVLLWIFAIFIDYGSSVVRSCLMISAYYGFVLLQRKPDLLHAMAIAGFAILMVDTQQLFDVGFQLSFLAVLGIYWLNEPILRYLRKPRSKVQNFLVNMVSIGFAAQLATLPLVVYYFHQYSFLSIIANLVILPFSEIIIIFSLLMTFLLGLKFNFSWLNFLYDFIVKWLMKSIHFFAEQDWFFIKNIPLNLMEMAIVFVCLYFLKFVLEKSSYNSFIKFSGVLLVFFGVRIFTNWYYLEKKEIMVAAYFKQKIFLVKNKEKAVFWIEENANVQKINKTLINAYLTNRRIENFEIKTLPKNSNKVIIGDESLNIK